MGKTEIRVEQKRRTGNFTEGSIIKPLLAFMLPVLAAMFLQAMYGAVDLMVVGHFADASEVSGVSTGSQITQTITNIITGFAMGITVVIGQQIGAGKTREVGRTIGTGVLLFGVIGIVLTAVIAFGAGALAKMMNAPEEAFRATRGYIFICGLGFIVIIGYNLISSIFRGIGDSKTPLIAVMIACICNIFGDLLMVAVFHLGAEGAAIATVAAQLISVILSLVILKRRGLPFEVHKEDFLHFEGKTASRIVRVGIPIALQDFLVSLSFLVILAIVNSLGVTASAGVGVAEKVCAFIMLIPSAFMQAMSAFVAQNVGAGKLDRAKKTLVYGIGISLLFGVVISFFTFRFRMNLCGIFTTDPDVIAAGAEYLCAYAIDCILTCFLFCFIGYFNGLGETALVMIQGVAGAFAVRIPVAVAMSRQPEPSLFKIGLGIPCATVLQIIICIICYRYVQKKAERGAV